MPKLRRPKKRISQIFWSLIGALIVGYFLYHTIQGDRGWFAMLRMQHEVDVAESNLATLQKEREEYQHKTQLLRKESLDPDLLEEKSRELLNYSKPNEIIILTPREDETSQK